MSINDDSLKGVLYDKTYDCPICANKFTSKTIKINTNKVVSSDLDLYAHYATINPLLYEIILCPNCGYAALIKTFDRILPTQVQWIKTHFTAHYKKRTFSPYTSLKEAIIKHQLALVCGMIKKSKSGELGYLALHIAWLYRDLQDEKNELIYLQKAFDALSIALQTEHFPLLNLDVYTTSYILAAISYRFGRYDVARSYLADIILSAHGPIKDRALDLKNLMNSKKK